MTEEKTAVVIGAGFGGRECALHRARPADLDEEGLRLLRGFCLCRCGGRLGDGRQRRLQARSGLRLSLLQPSGDWCIRVFRR